MQLNFWLIQLIGLIAWIILVLSYYRKDTNKILIFHIIATVLYSFHFYFLKAYSGLFICIMETIISYLYYKSDKDKYIFLLSIPMHFIIGIFSYKKFMDILPITAGLIDGYSLTKKKKIIVIGAIISYSLWIIYDIYVKSYSGIITDGILVLSNLSILLFKYDIFKTGKDEFNPKKIDY